jgi:hypothetical protein
MLPPTYHPHTSRPLFQPTFPITIPGFRADSANICSQLATASHEVKVYVEDVVHDGAKEIGEAKAYLASLTKDLLYDNVHERVQNGELDLSAHIEAYGERALALSEVIDTASCTLEGFKSAHDSLQQAIWELCHRSEWTKNDIDIEPSEIFNTIRSSYHNSSKNESSWPEHRRWLVKEGTPDPEALTQTILARRRERVVSQTKRQEQGDDFDYEGLNALIGFVVVYLFAALSSFLGIQIPYFDL